MQAWTWWLVAALVLAGVEIVTVDLIFVMLAVGALAAVLATVLGAPVWLQFATFAVVAVALLALVRPVALRHLRKPPVATGVDALLGAEALVLETVDGRDGRINLRGEIWSARADDDQPRTPGTTVRVTRIDGATAIVT